MAAKAVLRDVSRVLNLPYLFVDEFVKLVPNKFGISLADAREKEPQIDGVRGTRKTRRTAAASWRTEGITRNVGVRAGGVLIAPGRLTDFCPLYRAEGSDAAVSQFDKDDVEAIGLVKFGLRTLTILAEAVRFECDMTTARTPPRRSAARRPGGLQIVRRRQHHRRVPVRSRSAKDLEKKLKGDCFEDIIALMALNQPGPLGSGMVDDFIRTRAGQTEAGVFPSRSRTGCLRSTFSMIVYQEQVVLMSSFGGYSLGGADMLRRAMGGGGRPRNGRAAPSTSRARPSAAPIPRSPSCACST